MTTNENSDAKLYPQTAQSGRSAHVPSEEREVEPSDEVEDNATLKSRTDGTLASLGVRLAQCSFDELRVIDVFLRRLEGGRNEYGPLDLRKPRNWRVEKAQERFDAEFYDACEVLVEHDLEVALIEQRYAEAETGQVIRVHEFDLGGES